jgi:hypothetical protein
MRSRVAGGLGGGALAGWYPDPALGLPCAAGWAIHDNFLFSSSTRAGDLDWIINATAGTPTWSGGFNPGGGGIGSARLVVNAIGEQGSISANNGNTTIPTGLIYAVRLGAGAAGYTSITWWSGMCTLGTTAPQVATNTNFIGFRSIDGANFLGIAKDGATAANESTVDMGVSGGSGMIAMGFEVNTAGSSITFFNLTLSDRQFLQRTDVGTVTTNIPTSAGIMVPLGGLAQVAATRQMDIDWVCAGGRIAQ